MQLISRHKLRAEAAGIWVTQSCLIQYIPGHFGRTLTLKSAIQLCLLCEGPGTGCDLEAALICFECFLEYKERNKIQDLVFLAIS